MTKIIIFISDTISPCHLYSIQSTSVPGVREDDCTCIESSSSAVIAVSAVSLLLIVTLTIVILTQCLLMIRMRKTKDVLHSDGTYEKVTTPTAMDKHISLYPNRVYALNKMISSNEEIIYDVPM